MDDTTPTALFEEEQTFRQPWLWALLLAILAIEVGLFGLILTQGPVEPAVYIFCGAIALVLGIIWLMYALTLTVRVFPDRLHIHFFPLLKREIPLDEITSSEARQYRPILEYGGWGVRYSFTGYGTAYNVSGNRGVQLVLSNGRRLLIGSQRPEELADAISRAKHKQ